jgi:hypothetical protein
MSCASFGTTSQVSLFYAIDPDPSAALPDATVWKPVPFTSESLDSSISISQSEQIRSSRAYVDSKPTQGDVTGSISFEVFSGSFMENMLISVLQAAADTEATTIGLHITEGTRTWADTKTIKNGKKPYCLAFLRRVERASGNFDFFLYRGCQVGALSASMDSGSMITGDVTINGTGVATYSDIATGDAPIGVGGWTFEGYPTSELMSSAENFSGFEIREGGSDTGVVAQSVSFSLDNQLRTQYAVGKGTLYASGVASNRFMATLSVSAYYSDPTIYDALLASTDLSVVFSMKDDSTKGFDFSFPLVKVNSGGTPQAGGTDSDLMLSTELQAYEHSTGTCLVTLDVTGA